MIPFNKVRDKNASSIDVNIYTIEYLTKIETFARKYDVLVFIVAHPTKMYKNSDGKIEEPNMYNIKGGGEWYDASYHGLLIHRDYEKKTPRLKFLKLSSKTLGIMELNVSLLGNLNQADLYLIKLELMQMKNQCRGNKCQE